MDLLHIAVRAAFSYAILLALLRVSGKRTVAQGTPFDFVLALVLGDMVDDVLWGDVPTATFVVAAATLTLLNVFVSWCKVYVPGVERLVAGKPALLMSHGQLVEGPMRRERVSESEVEELLRLWGVPREKWQEVESAVLEEAGLPSVAKTELERPASRGDVGAAGRPS